MTPRLAHSARSALVPALLLLAPLGAGCASDAPAWAIDPMWLEAADEGVHGFQTWQVYTPKWERKQSEKTYLCAVVVELAGPQTPCTDCQIAWQVTPEVLETDCPAAVVADGPFLSVQRVSVGLPIEGGDVTHPGLTSQSFADYGFGWEIHGEAWPDPVDDAGGVTDPLWTGEVPFELAPQLAWPLE